MIGISFIKRRLHNAKKYFLCWKNQFVNFCAQHNRIVLVLLWHMAVNLPYFLFLEPSYVVLLMKSTFADGVLIIEAAVSILSPLAGSLADLKYGHYKVLRVSTRFMIAFESIALLSWILLTSIVNKTDYKFYVMISLLCISLICYFFGRVFFITNIIQFGIGQLRDEPTRKSDIYITIVIFMEALTNLLIKVSKSLFYSRFYINSRIDVVHIGNANIIAFDIVLSISVILSVLILFLVEKYSESLEHENIKGNPYKLVYNVIKFTLKHKKPIRRSAFTFYDDERPSRIDFGKQRYGGPFTTEQVEDVKVMINITKILLAVGPFFLLDLSGRTILSHYRRSDGRFSDNTLLRMFAEYSIISSLTVTVSIPVFLFFIKPLVSRCRPSILKRIGASLVVTIFMQLICIICSIFSKDNGYADERICLLVNNNTNAIGKINLITIPDGVSSSLLQILSALSYMLFYIAVLQFICCQSPQYMKGLLFGFYYFIKAVFQLISVVLLHISLGITRSFKFGCTFDYMILCLVIGLVTLLGFSIAAHRYKYRKRDDICNIYQYAEDYYTK